MLKNIKQLIMVGLLCVWVPTWALPKLSPGEIGGKAYILLEANSGMILAQYHATEPMAPASITKLMTAYVVYKNIEKGVISLDDKTVITARAREMGGSRMFLEQGSHVSINNLLSGLVIQSGNDAAVALAEAVAGDEERFVGLMNAEAKALGMTNTHYKNVSGMPEEGHYMSAKDIATLSLAIIHDYPEHYKRYAEKTFTWNKITQPNRNALLISNPNVDGLKTGHTKAAGFCLAASSKRGNMRLVSVVLGAKTTGARARASKRLLAYGFDNFLNQPIYRAGQQITTTAVSDGSEDSVAVGPAKAVLLPLPKENPTEGLTSTLIVKNPPQAPLKKGTVIGHFSIARNGEEVAKITAVALADVDEIGFFKSLWRGIASTVSGWFS